MTQSDYWDKQHEKYTFKDWIDKPTLFAQQVIEYFPKKGLILELGAGQGQDTRFFAEKGYEVLATDFSKRALELSKQRLPPEFRNKVKFQIVDLSKKLPFGPNSFEVVYSHLALHYFSAERTESLFKEIYEVLKSGGVFATITNTVADPEIEGFRKIVDDYYETPEGLLKRYFSVQTLESLTQEFIKIISDNKGETHKDKIGSLIRFVGRKPSPQPVAATSAIIERLVGGEEEILLQVRHHKEEPEYYGTWELPQGRIEGYENVYDALKREVFEETGLRVKKFRPDIKTRVFSPKGDGAF